jgi:hypothetical protein
MSDTSPRIGEVIAGQFRLEHGVTDRFAELTEHGYIDALGAPVEGELASWRYPTAYELADWQEAKYRQGL